MNERVQMDFEYLFSCSKPMLFKYLSTPEGLKTWFCDDIGVRDDIYEFEWAGQVERARCTTNKNQDWVRFTWLDRDSEEETLLTVSKSPLTNETVLHITTFCAQDEQEEETLYWDNVIEVLKHVLGA